MKKLIKVLLSLTATIIIVFLPYLLIIDFKKYTPVVLICWSFMVAFFIFVKKRGNSEKD